MSASQGSSSQVTNANGDDESTTGRVEQVCDITGDCGRWQMNITAFCITATAFTSLNNLVANFYQATSDFECTDQNFVSTVACISA